MKNEGISLKQRLRQRCEDQRREFLMLKTRLPEVATKFKSDIVRLARPKLRLAEGIVRSLSSDDWPRVYPKRMRKRSRCPSTRPEGELIAFDPDSWGEVDTGPLRQALEDCHRAFAAYARTWRALRRKSESEALALGEPKP